MLGVPKTQRKKKKPPVSRGRPSRLRHSMFNKNNASLEGELRTKKPGRDIASTHHGSLADIIKEVASRKHRQDQPF